MRETKTDIKDESNRNKNGNDRTKEFFKYLNLLKFPILLFLLSFILKSADPRSITVWDEGWYGDIAGRMAEGSEWVYSIYLNRGATQLRQFDKPPFIFWFGAIWIFLLGRTNLGIKMPMILAGTIMVVVAYYFFTEKKEERATGVIAGLLVASSSFVNWWSRTAYIDIFVAGIAALAAIFAIKGLDAVLKGDYKRGSVHIAFFGIVNSFNILTKAWQGLTIAPAIGIYVIIKYYNHVIDKTRINASS